MEPEKPFACSLPECGMTFTNEDHLHVHTKKHAMALQLGMEQKAAFVADQTPTPTRFIRNCEEVGLFQDLQNVAVNPFDEGFKRAMETKQCVVSLEGAGAEDALHTPHLVFPLEAADCTLYNHRNITISRSSSDESGAVKEYETTKISTLTNEVTTISRIVGKDVLDRVTTTDDVSIVRHEETTTNRDRANETSVSYTNNVIKIHSNVEIRKDNAKKAPADSCARDTVNTDVALADKTRTEDKRLPPIMSQRSLDMVVDSLAADGGAGTRTRSADREESKTARLEDDYEVIIKLPNGKHVRMRAAEESEQPALARAKEKLNKTIRNKMQPRAGPAPLPAGTLIPVTIVAPVLQTAALQTAVLQAAAHKIPILPLASAFKRNYKTVKRKADQGTAKAKDKCDIDESKGGGQSCDGRTTQDSNDVKKNLLINRSAASKRYRERLKQSMQRQREENRLLRESNRRLSEERARLRLLLAEHLRGCPLRDRLREHLQEKFRNGTSL